jgi:hypothetical protein
MRHANFVELLRKAVLTHGGSLKQGQEAKAEENQALGPQSEEDQQGSVGAEEEKVDKEITLQENEAEAGETEGLEASTRKGTMSSRRTGRGRFPKSTNVKVQWDPERSPDLQRLPYRSIQIGIPAALSTRWIEEWIVGIEDVTHTARELKMYLDRHQYVTTEELVHRGLMPMEPEFVVPDDVQDLLGMHAPMRDEDDK